MWARITAIITKDTMACQSCANCISSCGSMPVGKASMPTIDGTPQEFSSAKVGSNRVIWNGNSSARPETETEAPNSTTTQKIIF